VRMTAIAAAFAFPRLKHIGFNRHTHTHSRPFNKATAQPVRSMSRRGPDPRSRDSTSEEATPRLIVLFRTILTYSLGPRRRYRRPRLSLFPRNFSTVPYATGRSRWLHCSKPLSEPHRLFVKSRCRRLRAGHALLPSAETAWLRHHARPGAIGC
jgi:hypothetical protein